MRSPHLLTTQIIHTPSWAIKLRAFLKASKTMNLLTKKSRNLTSLNTVQCFENHETSTKQLEIIETLNVLVCRDNR